MGTMQVLNGEKEVGLNRAVKDDDTREYQDAVETPDDSPSGIEDGNGNSSAGMESSNWEEVAGKSTASMP